ncbi:MULTISPECIES: hypothetical protein [unclassified Burkholderia]|uniref:hypothetical protein n=1 Tax=unclassified Burkholderia TaxID=2613784 RepID=UPI002AB0B750|nr:MULTISPECIES: hypothetical protein [unclassified Burkholderia]
MTVALASMMVAANAQQVNGFRVGDYIACDAHSADAINMAKEAVRDHRPVEDIVNRRFAHPQMIDVKLSLMAEDMIVHGDYLRSGSEQKMQGFLAGMCYETGTR